jgi:hypothetical protein
MCTHLLLRFSLMSCVACSFFNYEVTGDLVKTSGQKNGNRQSCGHPKTQGSLDTQDPGVLFPITSLQDLLCLEEVGCHGSYALLTPKMLLRIELLEEGEVTKHFHTVFSLHTLYKVVKFSK